MTTSAIRYTIVLMPEEPTSFDERVVALQPGTTITPSKQPEPLPVQPAAVPPTPTVAVVPTPPIAAPVIPPVEPPAALLVESALAPPVPAVPIPAEAAPVAPANPAPAVTEPAASWSAAPETPETWPAPGPDPDNQLPPEDGVSWVAPEYIGHHKTSQWYLGLAGAALVVSVVVWLLTKDKISAVVVLIGAAFFGGYGARQPRDLTYQLDYEGLSIAEKYYPFTSFRSFDIDREAALGCINLLPLKRFAPAISVYFQLEHEEQIVRLIAPSLPQENHHHDAIDRFVKHIRF